jgi:Universal stress protein family
MTRRSVKETRHDAGSRILVAVDTTPDENNSALQRTEQFARMAGSTMYLLRVTRGHIVPMGIIGGSSRAVVSAEYDADNPDRQVVQDALDRDGGPPASAILDPAGTSVATGLGAGRLPPRRTAGAIRDG